MLYIKDKGVYLNENCILDFTRKNTLRARYAYYKVLSRIIIDYDIVYVRNFIADMMINSIISSYEGTKILEIPTNIKALEAEISNPLGRFLIRKYQPYFLRQFDHILIYGEPSQYEITSGVPLLSLQNGVSVEVKAVNRAKSIDYHIYGGTKMINLVSVANNSVWHGYDRVIRGMYQYYKGNPSKPVHYHCVGEGDALPELKELVNELDLNSYVIFHGTKTGQELDRIFEESDIAIGSLGNHRKRLYTESALKSREYCARGVPFVISSNDQDFPESFPYILKIPSDESPVDINKIVEWYEELTNSHPDYSTEMRKYAEEHLSWNAKMKPVIEKIKEIAEEKGKSRP